MIFEIAQPLVMRLSTFLFAVGSGTSDAADAEVDFMKTAVNAFGIDCDPSCTRMLEEKKLSGQVLQNTVCGLTSQMFEDLLPSGKKRQPSMGRYYRRHRH